MQKITTHIWLSRLTDNQYVESVQLDKAGNYFLSVFENKKKHKRKRFNQGQQADRWHTIKSNTDSPSISNTMQTCPW